MRKSTSPRDDFNRDVIETLYRQVSGVCSNPDCMVVTTGPVLTLAPKKSSNIGVAAHITAAAKGGPRYDSAMSSAERKSAANGIWVCHNCSRKIDNDDASYPVELLDAWKKTALEAAVLRHSKPQLTEATVEARVAAAICAQPSKHALKALPNARKAVEAYLNGLDERFRVHTDIVNGMQVHSIHANTTTNVQWKVTPTDAPMAAQAIKSLFEEGRGAQIPLNSFELTGSPLFDELLNGVGPGTLSIEPTPRKATMRLTLLEKATGARRMQLTVDAELTSGTKAASVVARLWGGAVTLTASFTERASLKVGHDLNVWEGRDIRTLPDFEAVQDFARYAHEGMRLELAIYSDSRPIYDNLVDMPTGDFTAGLYFLVDYLACAREFAFRYQFGAHFRRAITFDHDDYVRLRQAFDVLTGARPDAEVIETITVSATFVEGTTLEADTELSVIKCVTHGLNDVPLFDSTLRLPPVELEVTGRATAKRRTYKPGQRVTLKFDPRAATTRVAWRLVGDAPAHLVPREPSPAAGAASSAPSTAG